jgi:hypothetical protein
MKNTKQPRLLPAFIAGCRAYHQGRTDPHSFAWQERAQVYTALIHRHNHVTVVRHHRQIRSILDRAEEDVKAELIWPWEKEQ